MKLRRLLDMGLPELAGRSRQALAKRWERLAVPAAWPAADAVSLHTFTTTVPERFFAGAVAEVTGRLVSRSLGEHRDETVAVADAVAARRFDLLGYRGLSFGEPIDWHLDPVSGRRAPRVHWSLIDPLDAEEVGDSKVVWELSRQQWLVRTAAAYRLTGDERHAQAVADTVRQWLAANPPGVGINWASSLECALRLIAWCWMLVLLRDSAALTPALFAEMVAAIRAHAEHVERYLSYYFSPNTHLTGEALGLVYAGTVFPELPGARRWRDLGSKILLHELETQVLADGTYVEQATCYHRYTAEIYLHWALLSSRSGVVLPRRATARIQRLLDALLALLQPDGSMPAIGDADGGWILPLATRAPQDCRGVFSTAAAMFARDDYAWAAGGLAPETVWLLGGLGRQACEWLRPTPPAAEPSRRFVHGGLVVMRSGWDARAHQLLFDAGPLGCPRNAGHGHADLLSVQCAVFGRPCLVDPGTFGYTAEPAWRDFFRGTSAHSTIVVDGLGQAEPAGPFKWQARPRARLHRWVTGPAVDLADASHDAYARLADPVTHRRRVLFVKPRYWILVDDLDGRAEHAVDARFQFAPLEVTLDAHGWTRARVDGDAGLLLRTFAVRPLKAEVHEGEIDPPQGWVAPDYGVKRPAPLVCYSTVTRLPLRLVTLLFPTSDVVAAPPVVSVLVGDGGAPAGLVVDDGHPHTTRFEAD